MLIVLKSKVAICVLNVVSLLDENSAEILVSLWKLDFSIAEDTKMVLVYVAGYIMCNDSRMRNDSPSSEEKLINETTFTIKSIDNI